MFREWITVVNKQFQSPVNTQIEVKLTYVGRTCSQGCFFGGVEMKMTGDMGNTGYR
jgi:hypothetical protein